MAELFSKFLGNICKPAFRNTLKADKSTNEKKKTQ